MPKPLSTFVNPYPMICDSVTDDCLIRSFFWRPPLDSAVMSKPARDLSLNHFHMLLQHLTPRHTFHEFLEGVALAVSTYIICARASGSFLEHDRSASDETPHGEGASRVDLLYKSPYLDLSCARVYELRDMIMIGNVAAVIFLSVFVKYLQCKRKLQAV